MQLRYVVEVKDQFGWIDYDTFGEIEDATKLAKELMESFGSVRVVDKENMVEIKII